MAHDTRSLSVELAFENLVHEVIERAHCLLPEQGPIEVFIHHNTLHHWEDHAFTAAIEQAAKALDAKPYLGLDVYQNAVRSGRIAPRVLTETIRKWVDAAAVARPWMLTEKHEAVAAVRQLLAVSRFEGSLEEISWILNYEASDAVREAYRALQPLASRFDWAGTPPLASQLSYDELQTLGQEWFIVIASTVLDRGTAFWELSGDQRDVLVATQVWTRHRFPRVVKTLERSLSSDRKDAIPLMQQLLPMVDRAGLDVDQWLLKELLSLPGWAGQFSANLENYLAAKLWLKVVLHRAYGDRQLGVHWKIERPARREAILLESASVMAPWTGAPAQKIARWKASWNLWEFLLQEFDTLSKQRLLHEAYEESYFSRSLSTLTEAQGKQATATAGATASAKNKRFTAVFCIDDREESIRRHLEFVAPDCQTQGFAGFFGVDLKFQSHAGTPVLALCPPVLSPIFVVNEQDERTSKSKFWQRQLMRLEKWLHEGSRSELWLMPVVSLLGFIFLPLLLIRLQFPKVATAWTGRFLGAWNRPEPKKLVIAGGMPLADKVAKVAGMIRILRLTEQAEGLVFVLGHGATTTNNPHASAYNCGACGGHRGATNARMYCQLANDPLVREGLVEIGLTLTAGTYFVAGCHDTAADVIELFDTEAIPQRWADDMKYAREKFDKSLARNALERSRRFMSAHCATPEEALAHVETRSMDLREPRTECGHATNALCIVGTRVFTERTFFDRRAFLVSYDSAIDDEGNILKGLLNAVVPVCSGISLEYFFSTMDPKKYGCGTKLPHNVAAMVGVMDGSSSDLRTGLPTQMTEIHEPMRIMFIIEGTEDIFRKALAQLPYLQLLLVNEWIHLSLFDRERHEMLRLVKGDFVSVAAQNDEVVPVKDTLAYSLTSRDHLNPAVLEA